MNFYEKIILKDVRDFQNLTAEEKERTVIIFSHKIMALWVADLFMNTMIPIVISILLGIINMIMCIVFNKVIVSIIFFLTLPIMISILVIYIIVIYKLKHKKQTDKEIKEWLIQKIQNLWLLNYKVISFKDWKFIKKRHETLYERVRSEYCNQKCYFTSYALVNVLENPEFKILWIGAEYLDHRCGHSVITRKNKIYDSNLRRTYDREKYLKAFNAEVFKEYSIDEYLNKANLQKSDFDFLDWEEFGKWCEARGVIRSE